VSSHCFYTAGELFCRLHKCLPMFSRVTQKRASKSAFDCTLRNEVLFFFPHIMHPCFDLSTLFVTFTIIMTHKRENKYVCTAIFAQLRRMAGVLNTRVVQARTSGDTHRGLKLTHAQTECPYALCSNNIVFLQKFTCFTRN